MKGRTQSPETEAPQKSTYTSVPATCGCGNVKLLIQRPQQLLGTGDKSQKAVQLPWSPYPDLMFPYKTTPKDKLDNPSDEKWYLRKTGGESKYMAGTCACKSCRLITGYEIQTWAFIPRVAISILISPDSATTGSASNISARDTTQNAESSYIPLDFEVLGSLPDQRNPLRTYESSPGVLREFCHGCGATVFWHSKSDDPNVTKVYDYRTAQTCAAYLIPYLDPHFDALDVSSGPGGIIRDLALICSQGHTLGPDMSQGVVLQAESKHKYQAGNLSFAVGNAEDLSQFLDNSFDVVHSHMAIFHLRDPAQAFREFIRVCRPEGVVATRDPGNEWSVTDVKPDLPVIR
ncbi:hypothetical protein INS49_001236 [Diaporthe citri]|uniref:uncharacterized protein n=1 Tax=Diaporthe citri TaxID=83186 RepID=UPI001C7EE034|nr:uncharacterized protein INS49_001236 [Diaporthe citri]KAG6367054.1 hypothetical protein INS49_001236 [Diaporthe citri]